MAHSPSAYDRGTRFTNYSSIHSADAFVGDYQVMYTPGTSPPNPRLPRRPTKPAQPNKSTRFRPREGSVQGHTATQSYVLPNNIPNTSQIVPNNHGALPDVQIRYTIPADEKQIVASLRTLQHSLDDAVRKIDTLTRERDDARQELQLLKTTQPKQRRNTSPHRNSRVAAQVDEELFDFSRLEESPRKSYIRENASKKVSSGQNRVSQPIAAEAVSRSVPRDPEPEQRIDGSLREQLERQHYKKPAVDDPENSIAVEQPTAASNTSRFRRRQHALDENMTSAYILQDITVAQPAAAAATGAAKQPISAEAQQVLHSHDPQHINNCAVCRRLTTTTDIKPIPRPNLPQITEAIHNSNLEDPTIRPKISPNRALKQINNQAKIQFQHAKERFHEAFARYDAIPAPKSSKMHQRISEEISYWQARMEEYRVNLDHLRDVEEGLLDDLVV